MSITVQNLTRNDFTKVCRSCLSIIHLRPLFDNTPKCDLLRNMLMNYTRLKLHVDDILPKQICDQCSKKLIDFASFISNCNKINHALMKLIDACSQTALERNNAKHVENLEISEDIKDPSIVTQAFKIWLNDFQQSTNNQNALTENQNITNVSNCQTNEISAHKTIYEEVQLLDEIKEDVFEDVALEKVDEEKRLEFYSNLNTETKNEIQFEYVEVKAEEIIDFVELPIERNTNLSCGIYKNLPKNDHEESKKFNCRLCDLFFESIADFLTHCVTHRDQECTDVQQEENRHSKYGFNKTQPLPPKRKQIKIDSARLSKRKQITTDHVHSHKRKQMTTNSVNLPKATKKKVSEILRNALEKNSVNLHNSTKKRASEILKNALEKNKKINNSYFKSFLSYITGPKEVLRPCIKNRVDIITI